MSNAAVFTNILHEQYGAQNAYVGIFPVSSNAERAAFQVDLPNNERWVVHAQRSGVPIPAWLDGCGSSDVFAFFQSRAQTLVYLEQQAYAAPRVVRTQTGALVGEAHGWVTLVVTFVLGDVTQPTPEQLRLMGVTLAKLHYVPVATNALVGKSWWYFENIIGSALAHLAMVDGQVPPKWQPLHNAMRSTLETAQGWTHLPRAIIHGDAWAGNGVQTGPNEVVLIDWDPSGIGCPILDLARLLIQSPLALSSPIDVVLQPDLQRINAVVDGYCTERVPTAVELDVLPDAIRFTLAAGGAWHFRQSPHKGWDRVAPILARRQHRYDVSDAFASIAHKCFEHHR